MPPWRATHNLTYDAIAAELGVRRCRGRTSTGRSCDENHDGAVMGGQVHWRDRRVTRAGIKRFLLLASILNEYEAGPAWQVLYLRYRWVGEALRRLGFRLSKDAWTIERARLRAMIVKAEKHPDEAAARAEALEWARG